MKHLIKSQLDFWSGAMFAGVGAVFAGIAYNYKLGTAARMGPGFFPFYLGLILMGIGIIIIVLSLRGTTRGEAVAKFHWLPLITVLGSICIFGILLKVTGAVVAGIALVIGSSLGSGEFKFREILLLAIGLSIFCAAVFIGGLKLPIPVCPGFEYFEQYALCRV